MKKIFLISSIILGIALLLLAVYNFVFRHNINNPSVEDKKTIEVKSDSDKPIIATDENIKILADENIFGAMYDAQENAVRYFVPQSHELKKVFIDTASTLLIMTLSGEPLHVQWSPLNNQALVEIKNDSGSRWFLVDMDKKTEVPLKDNIETPTWTSMGDRIIYKYYDVATAERSLNSSNPDGSDWKKIGESPFKNMSAMVMPQSSVLTFWNRGDAFEETSLRTLSIVGGAPKVVFSGKFGADYIASPDGQQILMSSTSQKGGMASTLGLLLNQGTQYQNLQIPTLVSKATWAKNGKTVYYALPGSLPETAVMPNDYFLKPLFTQDTFWKVNLETGEKERVIDIKDIAKSYDASSMMVSDDETMLMFVNRIDGRLYSIELK